MKRLKIELKVKNSSLKQVRSKFYFIYYIFLKLLI